MAFLCKKCKKAFRKDMEVYEDSDEYCPHCDNHYVRPLAAESLSLPGDNGRPFCVLRGSDRSVPRQVIAAKTPNAMLGVESEDTRVDNRCVRNIGSCNVAPSASLRSKGMTDSTFSYSPNRAIKDGRVAADGKIDTSELDEWLTHLDGAPGPATAGGAGEAP